MKAFRLKNMLAGALILVLILLALLIIIDIHGRPAADSAAAVFDLSRPVVIDAGHGGLDGGAVSNSGNPEAGINLSISLKTSALMQFLGINTVLTRTGPDSLNYNSEASVRENKNADIYARYDIAMQHPGSDFLSIHLNKFGQQSVRGAQVFYSPNRDESLNLANILQERLRLTLDPENHRRAKMAPDSVYLMKTIHSTAVTIECGFLSNVAEEALLVTDGYQTKIALAITAGYIDYLAAAPPGAVN